MLTATPSTLGRPLTADLQKMISVNPLSVFSLMRQVDVYKKIYRVKSTQRVPCRPHHAKTQ